MWFVINIQQNSSYKMTYKTQFTKVVTGIIGYIV